MNKTDKAVVVDAVKMFVSEGIKADIFSFKDLGITVAISKVVKNGDFLRFGISQCSITDKWDKWTGIDLALSDYWTNDNQVAVGHCCSMKKHARRIAEFYAAGV